MGTYDNLNDMVMHDVGVDDVKFVKGTIFTDNDHCYLLSAQANITPRPGQTRNKCDKL